MLSLLRHHRGTGPARSRASSVQCLACLAGDEGRNDERCNSDGYAYDGPHDLDHGWGCSMFGLLCGVSI